MELDGESDDRDAVADVTMIFVISVVVAAVVILGLILYAFSQTKSTGGQ